MAKLILKKIKNLGMHVLAFSALTFTACGTNNSNNPQPNDPQQKITWKYVDAGLYHAAAIKSDGTLWIWGDNNYYQLGDGTKSDRNTPKPINNDKDWKFVVCGRTLNYAIKTDGSLWSWGEQGIAATYSGDGSTSAKNIPTRIGSESNWQTISTGSNHTLALKNDGSLWAWGNNNNYQLGDSTNVNKTTPIPIALGEKFSKIYAGDEFSIAIKADGTLWGWGSNLYGNLGNGSTSTVGSRTPKQIGTDNNWQDITAAWGYVLATKSDLSLWAWGKNNEGQLGLGNTTQTLEPTRISGSRLWKKLDAMNHGSIGIQTNGILAVWGQTHSSNPTDLIFEEKFIEATVGLNFNIAVSEDGNMYSWGTNNNGVLGIGKNGGTYLDPILIP